VISGERITIEDAASRFRCDAITIKRVLKDIRSFGIDIHSAGKKGIVLFNKPTQNQIKEITLSYFSAAVSTQFDRGLNKLVRRQKANAIPIITAIQMGIEKQKKVIVEYKKSDTDYCLKVVLDPLLFFHSDGRWRLLAKDNNTIKQFLIDKITNAELTVKGFTRIKKEDIELLFKGSFKSWIGSEQHRVVLRVYPPWKNRIIPSLMIETKLLSENEDGSIDIEMIVNSLHEIAGWIVSRGKGIKVIEPKELRKGVIDLAKLVLNNYKLG